MGQFNSLVVATTTCELADGVELVDNKSAQKPARCRSVLRRRFASSLLERERADCRNWELVPGLDRITWPMYV